MARSRISHSHSFYFLLSRNACNAQLQPPDIVQCPKFWPIIIDSWVPSWSYICVHTDFQTLTHTVKSPIDFILSKHSKNYFHFVTRGAPISNPLKLYHGRSVKPRLLLLLVTTFLRARQLGSLPQFMTKLEHHERDESQQRPRNGQDETSVLTSNIMEKLACE